MAKSKFDFNTGSNAKGFTPIVREDGQASFKEPVVVFTPEADAVVSAIQFAGRSDEVGWMMSVTFNEDHSVITLDKVYIPHQTVTATTTSMDRDQWHVAFGEWASQAADTGQQYCGWFHLHPKNMGVGPSGRDEDQMSDFFEDYPTVECWVRGIVNGKGERKIDVYYPNRGYAYADVEWGVDDSEHHDEIDRIGKLIQERATKRPYTAPTYQGGKNLASHVGNLSLLPVAKPFGDGKMFEFEAQGIMGDTVYMTNLRNNREYAVSIYGDNQLLIMDQELNRKITFTAAGEGYARNCYEDYLDAFEVPQDTGDDAYDDYWDRVIAQYDDSDFLPHGMG